MSTESVDAVAAGAFKEHVREILFTGQVSAEEEDGFDQVDRALSSRSEELLAKLSTHFPNLDFLNIGFAFDLYNIDSSNHGSVRCQVCLVLMSGVWTALSQTRPGIVKSLKLRHFVPQIVPVYSSSAFDGLLAGVHKFHISTWSSNSPLTAHAANRLECTSGVAILSGILGKLPKCVDLPIEPSVYGWWSIAGDGVGSYPFPSVRLPSLKRLKLHHCHIGEKMIDFLHTHDDCLEELLLQDCIAICNGALADRLRNDDNPVWADLFHAMGTMRALKKFEVLPENMSYAKPSRVKDNRIDVKWVRKKRSGSK